jgi:hypothetical protein
VPSVVRNNDAILMEKRLLSSKFRVGWVCVVWALRYRREA